MAFCFSIFTAVMLVFGRRFVPWLLDQAARTGSRELFTLAVLALALGIAFGSAELFGVSFALGDAFDPPLDAGAYDVALSRHVLWAAPDPAAAIRRWTELLGDGGVLVMIEGR